MIKLLKKLFILSFLLFSVVIGVLAYFLSQKDVMTTPFTYTISEKFLKDPKIAESSDILILGDRMGLYLDQFLDPLKNELKIASKKEPKIFNWSRKNEGLHRTFNKIKKLKKLPPIIIYHGGSSEWFDIKFNPKEKEKILYNFKQYANEKLISLIITFPDISRAIYKKVQRYELDNLSKVSKINLESDFDSKEIEYLYYEEELKQFIDYIKQNKSSLIIITTPINIITPPKEACPITSTNTIVEYQQEIENLIKEGNNKMALIKSLELSRESISNAKTYYLLGMSAKNNSEFKMAREAFTNANVFDCYNWRGNGVFNSIMKNMAKRFQVEVIDFESELTNLQIQSEQIFFDDIFPQNIYYNKLVETITQSVKKYLNINDNNNKQEMSNDKQ